MREGGRERKSTEKGGRGRDEWRQEGRGEGRVVYYLPHINSLHCHENWRSALLLMPSTASP